MHSRLAGTYVELTREEFEDWLNSKGFRGKWRIHPRYDGVYLLTLSDTVAISINSTTGSREQVMSKGRASMKMRLVSRVTNKVLLGPKKLMGKTHFARTTNWRQNWGKGLDRAKQTYDGSRSFYDAIAVIEDRLQYMDDTMDLIEQIPGWQQDSLLADLHRKVSQGGILTTKQLAVVQKARRNPPAPEPSVEVADEPAVPSLDEALLQRMRALYTAARNKYQSRRPGEPFDSDAGWTMNFAAKWGRAVKNGKTLSAKVRSILDKKFRLYGV